MNHIYNMNDNLSNLFYNLICVLMLLSFASDAHMPHDIRQEEKNERLENLHLDLISQHQLCY